MEIERKTEKGNGKKKRKMQLRRKKERKNY